jgi:hypothetical protein
MQTHTLSFFSRRRGKQAVSKMTATGRAVAVVMAVAVTLSHGHDHFFPGANCPQCVCVCVCVRVLHALTGGAQTIPNGTASGPASSPTTTSRPSVRACACVCEREAVYVCV